MVRYSFCKDSNMERHKSIKITMPQGKFCFGANNNLMRKTRNKVNEVMRLYHLVHIII